MPNEESPEAQLPINQLSQNLASAIYESTQLVGNKLNGVENEVVEGQGAYGLMTIKAFSEEATLATQRLQNMLNEVGTDIYDGQQVRIAGTMLEDSVETYRKGHQVLFEGYDIAYTEAVGAYAETETMSGAVSSITNQLTSQDVMPEEPPLEIPEAPTEESSAEVQDEPGGPSEQKQLVDSTIAKGQEALNSATELGSDVYKVRDAVGESRGVVEGLPLPSQLHDLASELSNMLNSISMGDTYFAQDAQLAVNSIMELIIKIDAAVTALTTNQQAIGETIDQARSATKKITAIAE